MKRKVFILFATVIGFLFILNGCGNNARDKNHVPDSTNDSTNNKVSVPDSVVDKATTSGIVSIDQLPASVKPYVEKNFEGYKISNATHDPLCSGGDAIDVVITKPGQANLSLIFIPDGTFVQKEEDVHLSTAPVKVKDVVKTKFAAYTAGNQIEKLTLADNAIEYLIDITKDHVSKEVILTPDGKVVCEN